MGDGARVSLGADGALVLGTAAGDIRQPLPYIYQESTTGERTRVDGRYVVRDDQEVGFAVVAYDRTGKRRASPASGVARRRSSYRPS